jgi:phosphatidylinositol alpha-mannosyltransferase
LETGKIRRILVAPVRLNTVDFSGFDVLHLHGDDWFYLRRRLPTVRTFYGSAFYEAVTAESMKRRISQGLVFPLEILAARLATRSYSLVPNDADGRWYRTSGGLEFGQDRDPLAEGTPKEMRPTVLFVGTWNGRKRGRLLAEAFSRSVLPRIPDAQLWMASDYAEESEHIRWLPRPSDEELADLYRRAWAFCLPSSYEGLGVPYLEAMARATPVIATPNIGARHILEEGRAGVICEPDDLGETLHRVLADAELRARLGAAAAERIWHFRWDRIVSLHEQAYEAAIGDWRRRTARRSLRSPNAARG